MTPLRRRFLDDMRLRNLAPETQRAYVRAVARFAGHFVRSPDRLGREHIREYLLHLIRQTYAWDTVNHGTSARARGRIEAGKAHRGIELK